MYNEDNWRSIPNKFCKVFTKIEYSSFPHPTPPAPSLNFPENDDVDNMFVKAAW